MNKKLGLAVAGALVAFSSAANAGITIPAGDWTVDLGGNVNAYYANTKTTGAQSTNTIGTGLLPAAIGIGAKSRQNDLDVAVQFTFFTGTSTGNNGTLSSNTLNIRQAFLTFGDASWGQVKLGRDLGVFGSDAILSDMTLLGVGANYAPNGSSTLGRIGSGYMYADWFGQIAYSTPNWNGFQATGAIIEPIVNSASGDATNSNLGYQGKITYDFAVNDVTGRVWVSGLTQKHDAGTALSVENSSGNGLSSTAATAAYTSTGFDIGAKASYQGLGLVGYYYNGDGLSGAHGILDGRLFQAGTKTKDSGGYVQATFVVPGVGTKLGASWGENNTNQSGVDYTNESWIVGAYHPLTKSVNLVAEYSYGKITGGTAAEVDVKTTSLGAILFF